MKHTNTLYGKIQGFLTLTVVVHIQDFHVWRCEKDIKWFTPWRGTQMLRRRYLLSKRHKVSRYTCKRNLIYAHKKGAAIPKHIFAKLTLPRDCRLSPSSFSVTQHWKRLCKRWAGGEGSELHQIKSNWKQILNWVKTNAIFTTWL